MPRRSVIRQMLFAVGLVGAAVAEPLADDPLRGHVLLAEKNCVACHGGPNPGMVGPVLDGLGSRLHPEWIREFLSAPTGHMPDLLQGIPADQRTATVEDLTHFLMSEPGRAAPQPKHGDAAAGARMYREIGCAACHGEARPEGLMEKYTLGSLQRFLMDPVAHRPSGRMPGMKLGPNEAGDLAAFLGDFDPSSQVARGISFEPDVRKVARGREAFSSLGCRSCHTRKGVVVPERKLPGLADLGDGGCLGEPKYGVPHFGFNPEDKAAIRTALDQQLDAKQKAHVSMAALNCYACHERDGVEMRNPEFFTGDPTLGNDGVLPPTLDHVGSKLGVKALAEVLEGKRTDRPYLNTRMPEFGKHAVAHLPDLFATADSDAGLQDWLKGGDLDAGKKLLGLEGGMGCITCHGWEKKPGIAMKALRLDTMATRLQPNWFRQHLIDPQSTRPGTLMQSFWPEGKSGNPNVLDGDTDRQIASIWKYLLEGKEPPPGYPDASSSYELVPTARPIVQRGFIDPAGTHAIAVGYPEGLHVLYDAKACRLVAVWKGRFLDAYKLWFSRLEPTTKPLGELRILPKGVAVERKFLGYMLEPSGVPVFRYREGGGVIEERIAPDAGGTKLMVEVRRGEEISKVELKWE